MQKFRNNGQLVPDTIEKKLNYEIEKTDLELEHVDVTDDMPDFTEEQDTKTFGFEWVDSEQ